MADLKRIALDAGKAQEGVWVPFVEDIRLKLRRSNNPEYLQALQKVREDHAIQIRLGRVGPKEDRALRIPLVARYIVVDWEHIEEGGKPLPYSPETAERLLSDPQYAVLFEFVEAQAADIENFAAGEEDQLLKNS